MFTGIVEELGIIRKLHVSGHSGSIEIEAHKVLRNTNVARKPIFWISSIMPVA